MASDIWIRTILIVRKETRCRHIRYSFRLTARVLLYAPSHRQDSTYHGLCYTSRGALAGTRNGSMGLPNEGSIRRPIAPSHHDRTLLPRSYISLPPTMGSREVICRSRRGCWHVVRLKKIGESRIDLKSRGGALGNVFPQLACKVAVGRNVAIADDGKHGSDLQEWPRLLACRKANVVYKWFRY